MPIWERYDQRNSVTNVGDHVNTNVLTNEEDTDNFQNADLIIVDGIITILTSTDDLCGVRLVVMPEVVVTGSITEDLPTPDSRAVWYSFFCGRGPLVFRMKSKKTIPPQNKLWVTAWKAQGTSVTAIDVGLMLLLQLKH